MKLYQKRTDWWTRQKQIHSNFREPPATANEIEYEITTMSRNDCFKQLTRWSNKTRYVAQKVMGNGRKRDWLAVFSHPLDGIDDAVINVARVIILI